MRRLWSPDEGRTSARRRAQRGIALIAVLWVTLLLGLMAASFLRETRIAVNLVRGAIADARAEALADAGIQQAMLALMSPGMAGTSAADRLDFSFTLDGGTVRVRIQDEAGKVDLNRASEEVLAALLDHIGGSPGEAPRLAAAIADFRDSDQEKRSNGAEDPDYLAAGKPLGAKDAPLTVIDELQQVLGMTPELYARVESLVTVQSPRRDVDVMTAPPELLRALPYVTEALAQQLLAARASDSQGMAITTATVIAEATTAEGGRFVRRAVIRRSPDPLRPFDILDWRRVWLAHPEMRAAS